MKPPPAVEELQGEAEDQEQVQGGHGLERFYLYEFDADQDQEMEEQYEDAGIAGMAEAFLLPELRFTTPYPERCPHIGPMGWDLVDPQGQLKPSVIAMTRDGRRFLIGHADWPDDETRSLGEHWSRLDGHTRTAVMTKWTKWRRDQRHEGRPRHE